MYDVIVLGATYAAAGIACRQKKNCLVLERRTQAGYEFFGTIGSESVPSIYPSLGEADVLFGTEVVSVEKTDEGFACMTHGVGGFRSYEAKKIVDTRCNAEMSIAKTYDLLIESKETPAFSGVCWEKTEDENRYVLRCPVPLSCGYVAARGIARNVIRGFSETQRLILSADEFDYQVKAGYPKTEGGILYLPSKAYEDPRLAFEAGMTEGEEK